jgi:hypothetical protein
MRVKSEIWVKAYLRRCQVEGASAVVARRGDEQAGAIYICINRLDGTVKLYGPAPACLEGGDIERRWVLTANVIKEDEAAKYLARQVNFDADVWIIEVEDKAGRHFLGDAVAEE